MSDMHQVNPPNIKLHPTSFRLSKDVLKAIEDGAAMFRMNRTQWIEFLARAAVSGHAEGVSTDRAKIEIKMTVINGKPRRPVPKNLIPKI